MTRLLCWLLVSYTFISVSGAPSTTRTQSPLLSKAATFVHELISQERFEHEIYNIRAHVNKRTPEQSALFLNQLSEIEPLAEAVKSVQAFDDHGYWLYAAGVTLHSADGEIMRRNASNDSAINIQELYQQRVSFVVKAELVNPPSPLQRAMQQRFSTDATVHAYVSPGEAQALKVSKGWYSS